MIDLMRRGVSPDGTVDQARCSLKDWREPENDCGTTVKRHSVQKL